MKEQFRELVSRASYHFAADRGTEYMKAYPLLDKAVKIARDEGWTEDTIRELMDGELVSADDIIREL